MILQREASQESFGKSESMPLREALMTHTYIHKKEYAHILHAQNIHKACTETVRVEAHTVHV